MTPADVSSVEDTQRRKFISQAVQLGCAAWGLSIPGLVHATTEPVVIPPADRAPSQFFPGFRSVQVDISEVQINGVIGGSGPPLLLLHGSPQTHITWRKVAPDLAKHYTVVATDLRGYGDSCRPHDGSNHEGHSKRAMANDQLAVMRKLGFDQFAVVGHDRGGRVGHRMVLDHPQTVTKLALLDIVPTYKVFTTVTREVATRYYYQFLMMQPSPIPETLIGNSAEFWLRTRMRDVIPEFVDEAAFAEYFRCFRTPENIHANCEDYRAYASIDLEHDEADLDKKIACPLLALWGSKGRLEPMYDVLACWRERATNVLGKRLEGTHWLPEEVPNEVCTQLKIFLQ
jgi:haloacetate dehalogenase